MILTLFDFEGNNLGYTDKIISSYRDEKFNDIGFSEFHINKDDPVADIILQNKYLIAEQDGVFQDIVVGSCFGEDFTIYCRSLNWLLSKMIIPPLSPSGTLSYVIEYFLSSSYGCEILKGHIPSDEDDDAEMSFSTTRAMLFSEAIKSFLSDNRLGHKVRFSHEDNCFYLDIIRGNNLDLYISDGDCTLDTLSIDDDILDVAQSVCYLHSFSTTNTWDAYNNSPTLYQKSASNLGKCYRVSMEKTTAYIFDLTLENGDYIYCNTADGVWKKSAGPPKAFYRYIQDESVSDKYNWFFMSSQDTKSEAVSEVKEKSLNHSFSVSVKNITFLKDYKLGDFVKLQYIQNNKLKTHTCQFTEVTLSRDSMENQENPTLEEVI